MAKQNRLIVYVYALVIVVLGALVGRWFRLQDSPGSYRAPVISGSMAASVPGPHYSLECYDCQIPLIVDASTVDPQNHPICFNCGASNSLEDKIARVNSVSFIDMSDSLLRRWQIAVFDHEESRYIKRIVGLPGEKIATQGGELYVDGELYQKSLKEFDGLSTVVFDSRFQPHDSSYSLLRRFGVRGDDQGWIYTLDNVFAFDAPEKTHPQWLDYFHWNVIAGFVPPVERGSPTAIMDYLPYNQYISRAELNFVDDFVIDLALRIYKPGVVGVRLLDVDVEIDFLNFVKRTKQGDWSSESTKIPKIDWSEDGTDVKIRLGRVDQQLIFETETSSSRDNIQPLALTGDYDQDVEVRLNPFSISADEGSLDVTHLKVARDIYWLGTDYTAVRWESEPVAGENSYLLIGDNQPVSRDCRQWGQRIPKEAMIGLIID